MTVRETWVTTHGVALHEPTDARPYYRLIGPRSGDAGCRAGKGRDQAWAKAWDIDAELAAAVADPTERIMNGLLNS